MPNHLLGARGDAHADAAGCRFVCEAGRGGGGSAPDEHVINLADALDRGQMRSGLRSCPDQAEYSRPAACQMPGGDGGGRRGAEQGNAAAVEEGLASPGFGVDQHDRRLLGG